MARHRLTREYSKRLGVLRGEALQVALDRFGLGELLAAQPAGGALTGMNVFLRSSLGEWVLRGRPRWPHQLEHERHFVERVAEAGTLPVASPYRLHSGDDPFGWPFALMARLPGVPTGLAESRLALRPASKEALAAASARTLASIHEREQPRAARFDPGVDGLVPVDLPHAEWVARRVR